MSSDKLIIFETLTPSAGSNSFKVTTGPWLTFLILPLTPKSNKIFSKNSGSPKLFFPEFSLSFLEGIFSKRDKIYTDKSEVINEYIPQEEIKNLIQEDLPFIRADEIK